ncbi:hypothetical protein CLI64_08505 [Nostoc sp. CENA543]|uniref:beta strand repeat-containing protein n=1 Tax=Nostoc sp. CENA543 TaxID=1869241 RepID=UPI000CA38E8D|nr:S-layer family protein [Nostoc sp. CENA543]AUT00426.1 hypothetical protein CLI64_08505 [Nostoc sp. CENA543]
MKLLYHVGIAVLFATSNCLFSSITLAEAIATDKTLSTDVTSNDGINFTISGGSQVGSNLFHSFSQFSVPKNGSANFNHSADIQNIISRVTGNLPSTIDGKIQANSHANLFLINPNGIIFGRHAQLEIGGSFFATTANSLKFADGTEFYASPSQISPLLSVSVPIGLQYGNRPAAIQSQAVQLTVQPNYTLALIGGEVNINGGQLQAENGRIELVGAGAGSVVGLQLTQNQSQLSLPSHYARADVFISNQAQLTTNGDGGGSIQLTGKQITIEDSRISAETTGSISGANITLNASDKVIVTSSSTEQTFINGLFAENAGSGDSAGITINTRKLQVNGEARISTATFSDSTGTGGDLTINASDAVKLNGVDSLDYSLFTGISTDTHGSGIGGNLTINTGKLIVESGAQISAATFSEAQGGNLTINAAESVELLGVSTSDYLASGLYTAVQESASGQAGNLTVNTQKLFIRDGAQIFAGTSAQGNSGDITINASSSINVSGISPIFQFAGGIFSSTNLDSKGNSGNITINTQKLTVQDGAIIAVETLGLGKGGLLTINSSDSIELLGQGALITYGENAANPTPSFSTISAGIFNKDNPNDAGSVEINTNKLLILGGSRLRVDNAGRGKGGNLLVRANSILLDNGGNPDQDAGGILATTKSGEGGDITLQARDILLLRNGSRITTDAKDGSGNGGNIIINTNILVAAENSDITANAIQGRGGNIEITAKGIFNIEFRPELTLKSDITASSQFGLSGNVEVNTLAADPSKGIVELPVQPNDASVLIKQGCGAKNPEKFSRFVVTGRSGLPQNPEVALGSDTILEDVQTVPIHSSSDRTSSTIVSQSPAPNYPNEIIEAQGLVVTPQGNILLTTQTPVTTSHGSVFTPVTCPAL